MPDGDSPGHRPARHRLAIYSPRYRAVQTVILDLPAGGMHTAEQNEDGIGGTLPKPRDDQRATALPARPASAGSRVRRPRSRSPVDTGLLTSAAGGPGVARPGGKPGARDVRGMGWNADESRPGTSGDLRCPQAAMKDARAMAGRSASLGQVRQDDGGAPRVPGRGRRRKGGRKTTAEARARRGRRGFLARLRGARRRRRNTNSRSSCRRSTGTSLRIELGRQHTGCWRSTRSALPEAGLEDGVARPRELLLRQERAVGGRSWANRRDLVRAVVTTWTPPVRPRDVPRRDAWLAAQQGDLRAPGRAQARSISTRPAARSSTRPQRPPPSRSDGPRPWTRPPALPKSPERQIDPASPPGPRRPRMREVLRQAQTLDRLGPRRARRATSCSSGSACA